MKNYLLLNMTLLSLASTLTMCATIKPDPETLEKTQVQKKKSILFNKKIQKFATPEEIEKFSKEVSNEYLIGPGDVVKVTVWKRPEISEQRIVVGANGRINMPRIGFVEVGERTLDDIQKEITTRLTHFYEKPDVTMRVVESKNNRVFVLGRVANPGEVQLPIVGANLLEVMALAGGLPVLDESKAPLTESVIIRGKKRIRINLKALLNDGVMSLNAKIQNNDVIFIPESGESDQIYLLGEVFRPGIVRLTTGMTFLDALMMAGGPSKSAQLEKTFLIRMKDQNGSIERINVKEMLEKADSSRNFPLEGGDVIFIARNGLSKFQDFFAYVTGILRGVDVTMSVAEKAGLMQKLRHTWWGQEGFVKD